MMVEFRTSPKHVETIFHKKIPFWAKLLLLEPKGIYDVRLHATDQKRYIGVNPSNFTFHIIAYLEEIIKGITLYPQAHQ